MKKIVFALFITISIVFCLVGCSDVEKTNDKNEQTTENKATEETESTKDKEVTKETESEKVYNLSELVTTEDTVILSDKDGDYTYTYPKINIDSEYVDKINKEIVNNATNVIQREEESNKNGNSIITMGMDYEVYSYDTVMSVIVNTYSTWGGAIHSEVYNIDMTDGTEIDNTYFIQVMNISEEELEKLITDRKLLEFKNIYPIDDWSSDSASLESYNNALEIIESGKWSYNDRLYFKDENQINLYCLLPSLAGAEAYNYHLDLVRLEAQLQ